MLIFMSLQFVTLQSQIFILTAMNFSNLPNKEQENRNGEHEKQSVLGQCRCPSQKTYLTLPPPIKCLYLDHDDSSESLEDSIELYSEGDRKTSNPKFIHPDKTMLEQQNLISPIMQLSAMSSYIEQQDSDHGKSEMILQKEIAKQNLPMARKLQREEIQKYCFKNSIPYKLKEYLNKQNICLKQHCNDILPDSQLTINQKELESIIQKCGFQLKEKEATDIYSDVADLQTKHLYLQTLQEILNMINIEESHQIMDIFLKKENISIIVGIVGNNRIARASITQILNCLNIKDEQKQLFCMENIIGNKSSISQGQFMEKIGLNIQTRKVEKQFYLKQKQKWVFKQYFNEQSNLTDQQIFRDPIFKSFSYHLNNKSIFMQEKKCWDQEWKSIILGQGRGQYCLFRKSELQLTKDELNILMHCMSPDDIIQGELKNQCILASIAALVQKNPKIIFRLFILHKNPSHVYGVRLFIENK